VEGVERPSCLGIMTAQRIVILQLDSNGIATSAVDVSGLPGDRYRSLVLGPDGNLYVRYP
jgi:hypothetical protein